MTPQHSSAWEHLILLSETIGPRPAGSAGYHQAAEHIRRAFDAAGLRRHEIGFDCVDWHHGETALTLAGERLPAVANVFSPACDVRAPLVSASTLAELERIDISGKVLLLYGDLSAEPLIPLNCKVYNAERDQRINRLLIERGPAAVIAVNLSPPAIDSRIEDADQPVPSATVPAEVGLRLLDHMGEEVHLHIVTESRPGRAATIIGSREGPSPARVTLMAHYDTKQDTPGAWDNASGVAALLALAEALAGRDLRVGLELIAFGDEEYYAYTDIMYVEQHGAAMADIVLAINMDGIGHRLGTNRIALMSASEALRGLLDGIVAQRPGMLWTAPWPQSNHSTFAWRGVPSIALNSNGLTNAIHQPGDTACWVSAQKLDEIAGLVLDIIEAVQGRSPAWTRG